MCIRRKIQFYNNEIILIQKIADNITYAGHIGFDMTIKEGDILREINNKIEESKHL